MAKAPQSANLVSIPVPNFLTGVSQQPAHQKLATSVDKMDNCWPSVITGCGKRPPTEYQSVINPTKFTTSVAGTILDKETEKLPIVVTIANNDLQVYDVEGVKKTVTFPDGKLYLNALDPAYAFRFLNIQDTTFILNKEQRVSMRDFGEPNASDYVPDGQVQAKKYLPDPNATTQDLVYEAYGEGKLYKNTYFPAVSALYRWDKISETQKTLPTDGLPVVTEIFDNDAYPGNQQVWLKGQGSYTQNVNAWVWNGSAWVIGVQAETVYYDTYTKYIKTVVNTASPSSYKWVEKTRAEIVTDLLAKRSNPTNMATVFVSASAANTNYNVYINNALKATFLTGKNVDATTALESTSTIAENLSTALIASGYTTIVTGSTITITNFPADATIETTSSQGDTLLKSFYNVVNQFSDLPPQSPHGRMVIVGGSPETGGDDYAVYYDHFRKQWIETYWYGRGAVPDNRTMPWVLIRNPDDTYTFKRHYWRSRPAGDQESNPHPRFADDFINDIFLYAGRLGFLTNSNIIFSAASQFEQFYKSTVATLQDDDRIDLVVATKNDDSMRYAIPYSRQLLVLADKTQYRFQYAQYLSASTAQISYTTSFNSSKRVAPVSMGASVFFADDSRSYGNARVYEYFPEPQSNNDDAQDITEPVPSYLPTKLTFLASAIRSNMLFCASELEPKSLYVYRYIWVGDKKVQSAWSKWTFNDVDTILWGQINRNYLYLLINRANGVFLERVKLDERVEIDNMIPTVFLDMKVEETKLTQAYNATDKFTYFTFPYKFLTTPKVVIYSLKATTPGGEPIVSQEIDVVKVSDTVVKAKGDYSDYNAHGGIPYTSSFTISNPLVRAEAGQGQTGILDGRLMVRWFNLEYHKAITFKVRVNKRGYPEDIVYHETNRISDAVANIDQSRFERGTFRVPIMGNNMETFVSIENDSPHDAMFSSGEWHCVYQPKFRRL